MVTSSIPAETILVITALVAAGALTAGAVRAMGDLARSSRAEADAESFSYRADLTIVTRPQAVASGPDNGEVTLNVANTGGTHLSTERLHVVANGQETTFESSLTGGADRWRPGVVAELNVTVPGLGGPDGTEHAVRVVHSPDVQDDLIFLEEDVL